MKKEIKLYNVIFPIWLLWLIPTTWIVVVPANFLIDLAVLVITMKCLKINDIKKNAKSAIIKTWIFGFLSDFVGTACMFCTSLIQVDSDTKFGRWWYDEICTAVSYNPLHSISSVLWVAACVAIAGVCIYFLNYKISFRKLEIEVSQKKKLALSLAVFTAPYLFFVPTAWFYRG